MSPVMFLLASLLAVATVAAIAWATVAYVLDGREDELDGDDLTER